MKMTKNTLLLVTMMVCFSLAWADSDPKYPVSGIPETLTKGCYAVVREESQTFDIYAINKTSQTVRRVVTILNKKGDGAAQMAVPYDKFRHVAYFHGIAYDASGKIIKKLKQNEILDRSSISGYSLFEDNRIKIADLSQTAYPYTVEFEYQVEMKFLYSIPDFLLYVDDEISTQRSVYKITYPSALQPRFKTFKIGEPKKEKEPDGRESVSWSFENIVPEKFEKSGPDYHKTLPHILAAPDQFEYGGYQGRMDTWQNLGKWQIQLNKGRDVLPEKAISTIRDLTRNMKTNEEKIKAVYEFLQNKTRYVSIQLGIGGLQPFEAKTVDEVSYGDCKALSNYTVALLHAIGINSYYTIIYGGDDNKPVIPDFVGDYFNHIVVAVPNEKDTLWLECTSQTKPFGYMGRFTGERKALMITEEGGKLVNTPSYPTEKNLQSRTAEVYVDTKGNASAKIKTTYAGLQYENNGLDFYVNYEKDEQKKWVQQNTEIPSFDINSFVITNKKNRSPTAIVELNLTLNRLATVSGKRLFLTGNLMNRSTYMPERVEKRRTNVVLKMGYVDLDTIRFHLPEELYSEFLPEPLKVKSRFGEYEAAFKIDQGKVVYVRKMVLNKGEFPPESYNELIEFYKSINKADNIKLVFLNKT
jgi:hypothetical protein